MNGGWVLLIDLYKILGFVRPSLAMNFPTTYFPGVTQLPQNTLELAAFFVNLFARERFKVFVRRRSHVCPEAPACWRIRMAASIQ